jgi:hypothetical protein
MEKICSKCRESKSIDSFYKLTSSKDGHRPDCKDCHNKQKKELSKIDPVKYKANTMATGILQRTVWEKNDPKNKCYEGIKCTLGSTVKKVAEYLYNNFYEDIRNLIEAGKTPSVDRIDSRKDYSPDNIRIIDYYENSLDGVKNAVKKTSKPILASKGEAGIIYPSVSAAAKALKIKRDTIYYHLDKGTKTQKGWEFKTFSPIF